MQASAFVTCFLDRTGFVQVVSSPLLQPRQEDLIPDRFRQRFARVLAEQNAGFLIDPTCKFVLLANRFDIRSYGRVKIDHWTDFRDSKGFRNSQRGSKCSEARARTLESQPFRSKRTLSNETFLAKRRKPGVQPSTEPEDVMSTLDDPTIKNESDTDRGDEEEPDDTDEYVGAGIILEDIRIDDNVRISNIIDARLKQMRQDSCKKIAKEWIKAVEPRKQTKYPYNGGSSKEQSVSLYGKTNPGEFTRPPWWCSTQGWKEGEGCRHKEPDHQKKAGSVVSSYVLFSLLII